MKAHEAVRVVLFGLAGAGLEHMVTGGLVSNHYGVARSTKDADIVVQMEPQAFARFIHALPPGLALHPQASFETITGSRRHIITVAGSNFQIELLGDDPHHQERFRRRVRAVVAELGHETWIPTAEDMVIQKVRWNRDKDRDDVKNIIGVQGDALDWPYIERWCEAHGTRTRLAELRAAIPPV
jgi:hypothetical protein